MITTMGFPEPTENEGLFHLSANFTELGVQPHVLALQSFELFPIGLQF